METLALSILRAMDDHAWRSVPEIRRRSVSAVTGDEVRAILRALRREGHAEKGLDPSTNRAVWRYVGPV